MIMLVLIGLLIFALYRGCNNVSKNAALAVNYKERILKLEQDSIEARKDSIDYIYRDSIQDGQLEISSNKLLSLTENLEQANERIVTLLNKHVPIKPSSDTSATLAPNSFIDDCADCFKELGAGQQLVRKYKAEKDNQEQLYKGQLNLKDNRIRSLEKSNSGLLSDYNNLLDSSKKVQDKFIPRGRLYLSWGVLWKQAVPWSAGAGLMYQTKRSLIIGASWYYNAQGHMIQTNIHFPLSLRMK